jgi:predicted transcriptional regulator
MKHQPNLGHLERQVMDFLWKNPRSTSEAVRAAVGGERPLTDSTIRTVLRRLEAKQYVTHEIEGRQFIYSSAREPKRVAAEAVRTLLRTFCRGSLEELLTGLVDHKVIKSAELRRLANVIEERERREKTRKST